MSQKANDKLQQVAERMTPLTLEELEQVVRTEGNKRRRYNMTMAALLVVACVATLVGIGAQVAEQPVLSNYMIGMTMVPLVLFFLGHHIPSRPKTLVELITEHARLGTEGMSELKTLCDTDPEIAALVDGWIAEDRILTTKQLEALREVVALQDQDGRMQA